MPDPSPAKHWWQSRTVWLGIATAAVPVIAMLVKGADGQPLVPASWVEPLMAISGVLTVILRSVTTEPIKPLS